MAEGKIYIHTISNNFDCDKVVEIVKEDRAAVYSIADGSYTFEDIDECKIVLDKEWVEVDGKNIRNILHEYMGSCGIYKKIIEFRDETIVNLNEKIEDLVTEIHYRDDTINSLREKIKVLKSEP